MTRRREARVLLIDADPGSRKTLEACALQGGPMRVFYADSLAQGRQSLEALHPIDLVVIHQDQPDGDALALVREIDARRRVTGVVMIGDDSVAESVVGAMRAGACDFLALPLDLESVNPRLRAALSRQDRSRQQVRRVRRLRRLCRRINDARYDISQQVDVLCHDLVSAYHELAEQMNQATHAEAYQSRIGDELGLEPLLRTTLEHLVDQAGPANAAIFLPSSMDEYTLGGYVNYDCPEGSADMLLDHLADVLAPRLSDREDVAYVTDDASMSQWLGDDAVYLADSELIAFSARHEGETLAVVTLFRDRDRPFDPEFLDACAAIGPVLGPALAKVIRVHHRHLEGQPGSDGGLDLFGEDDAAEDGFGDVFDPGDLPF